MKSVRTLRNSFIFAGLALGVAGSAFASQASAIQPKPSKGILSSLGSGLWYMLTHPKLTLPVTAGTTLYYLYNCRINCKNLPEATKKDIQQEIINLGLTSCSEEVDKTLFRNWNLKFGSAIELVANPRSTYYGLLKDFEKTQKKSNEEFSKSTLERIENEKIYLKRLLAKLDEQLEESSFLPRINQYDPSIDNPVRVLINRYKKKNNCDYIYQLPKKEFSLLDRDVNALISFSLSSLFNLRPWKTFNWHRLYALPTESSAIEQFWKLYQILAHLDALEYCINNKEKSVAPWLMSSAQASYLPTI